MTLIQLRDGLTAWINLRLPGVSVVDPNQGEPKLQKPFIELGLLSPSTKRGWDQYVLTDSATGTFSAQGNRRMTLQVTYVGANSQQHMEDLRNSIDLETVRALFRTRGFSVILESPVTAHPNLLDAEYEDRSSLDLAILYLSSVSEQPGYFTHAGAVRQTLS